MRGYEVEDGMPIVTQGVWPISRPTGIGLMVVRSEVLGQDARRNMLGLMGLKAQTLRFTLSIGYTKWTGV